MLNYCEINEIVSGKIKIDREYLLSLEVTVALEPLAYEVKGFTIPYGSWHTIIINSTIPDDQKWIAFLHELVHIVKNDCCLDRSVAIAEAENPY